MAVFRVGTMRGRAKQNVNVPDREGIVQELEGLSRVRDMADDASLTFNMTTAATPAVVASPPTQSAAPARAAEQEPGTFDHVLRWRLEQVVGACTAPKANNRFKACRPCVLAALDIPNLTEEGLDEYVDRCKPFGLFVHAKSAHCGLCDKTLRGAGVSFYGGRHWLSEKRTEIPPFGARVAPSLQATPVPQPPSRRASRTRSASQREDAEAGDGRASKRPRRSVTQQEVWENELLQGPEARWASPSPLAQWSPTNSWLG
eukprot:c4853_g1_i1.p1 GENE.c4853_g1_i1~~c4853_g1_i1.p1  ORF type:complete len:281 (+),score=26.08 c4853_g1_i1:67-843(+)